MHGIIHSTEPIIAFIKMASLEVEFYVVCLGHVGQTLNKQLLVCGIGHTLANTRTVKVLAQLIMISHRLLHFSSIQKFG